MSSDKLFQDNESVFPGFVRAGEVALSSGGLTKREMFAAMAMQGLCAGVEYGRVIDEDAIASDAVACADALLAKLTEPKQPEPPFLDPQGN